MSSPFSIPTNEHVDLIIIILLLVGMIAMMIKGFVAFRKELNSIPESTNDEPLAEPEATMAKVIFKRIDKHYEGSYKMPTYVEDYYVTFLTENGVETELSVFVEAFDAITIGQEGTLVTLDGKFFDFGDGEEISE